MIDHLEKLNDFSKGKEISLAIRFPSDKIFTQINSLFARILSYIDRTYLLDTLITVLRELILNYSKANIKRIHFQKLNLDINNISDYEKGIKPFSKEVINNLESIKSSLEKSTYIVICKVKKIKNKLIINLSSNNEILPVESERIKTRLIEGENCTNFYEAYDNIYDQTEGAGLGLILCILLLKKAGIEKDNFNITFKDNMVYTEITIPYNIRGAETSITIEETIIKQINFLPTFPENIIEIQDLCINPKTSIEEISSKIKNDPALSADVLKLSNSAGFITNKRVDSINKAVMVIGLKNLYTIITISAARKIMDENFKKYEKIWNHCNKISFYARSIAQKLNFISIMDKVFMSGLLHDIGKIVLLAADKDLVGQIADIAKDRNIRSSTILEEITIGISHSTIGTLIATKWNFPDYFIDAITNHHSPLDCSIENKDIVYIVYLANMLDGIETRKYNFYFLETQILQHFNLNDEEKLINFHNELKDCYSKYTNIG
jgi:putative nucleotidyltransferase with HDIG domain